MGVRIGVFGGTFNPIHLGHLCVAREIQKLFSLSRVHFVVATTPPHKSAEDLIPFAHRYAMVSLATAGLSSFVPSTIELEPKASAYSIDTMRKLARRMGRENPLYFIAGGDSLAEVNTWRESEKLLTSYNFIFTVRPGTGPVDPGSVLPDKAAGRVKDFTGLRLTEMRRVLREKCKANRIYMVDVGAPDISATRIRELASSGKPFQRMVPGAVREYIGKLHLYGGR
jgi:nicotinate-nucleotide adenylyltransferase